MDARAFVSSISRLTPPGDRPGAKVASRIDAAYLAGVAEIVRAYGDVSSSVLVGIEMSQVAEGEGGAEIAEIVRISDPQAVTEELDSSGAALVAIVADLRRDGQQTGVVTLTVRIER
jgi:hypothetical protein